MLAGGAAVLVLTGCSGFLVPAGEGEPPSPAVRARDSAPGDRSDDGDGFATGVPDTPGTADTPGGAATTSAPPQGAPTPSARAADCPESGARVDMGEVQAVMFARAVVLTLTNCGTQPYAVRGYPSVQALGEGGERLPVKVNPGGSMFGQDRGPQPRELAPGGTVRSILAWVSTVEGGDLIEADAVEIAAAPDAGARVFPLHEHDVRLMDELNMTAWRVELPE
ncbi:DUF4232 domain-containing protein [uncultured Streptomyces sp.]|uniref:DUF4232 domain-containing protein n=1 Tax=uncultured Streptomyces sp. TaxID=174707 RepID=UPI00262B7322|nr:DUF4232 domain-containing protein [uncultured Streptomyces sp.]